MGLIKAGLGALGGTLADQWKEFGQILPIEGTSVNYVERPFLVRVQKVLQNGQVLILRDGKTYNVMGIEIGE